MPPFPYADLQNAAPRTERPRWSGPTALLVGGAFAPYERFAAGKTSAQAEFTSAEH